MTIDRPSLARGSRAPRARDSARPAEVDRGSQSRATTRSHGLACASLCALYALLTWPVILSGAVGTPVAFDQGYYHLPVIRAMAAEFPHVDLVNYRAATTPGYHLSLALFARFISGDLVALQFVSNLFSMALIVAAYRCVARLCAPMVSWMLMLPLVCSMFVVMCGIWLATDNAAWAFVALAAGGASLLMPTTGRLIRWSLYATCAVVVRQIHLWVLAPIAVAACLASQLGEFAPSSLTTRRDGSSVGALIWSQMLLVAPALALPVVVIGICIKWWYGLTPLGFQEPHEGQFSVSAPAISLALLGLFGMFYLPVFAANGRALLSLIGRHWRWPAAAMIVAIGLPTTWDQDAGRWGGVVWSIARVSPSIAHTSIAIVLLAAIGGLVLAAACRAAAAADRRREAAIIIVALAAFTAAQIFNSLCFQRYFEAMILMALSWFGALALATPASGTTRPSSRWWLGLAGLTALQLVILVLGVYARLTLPAADLSG